MSVDPGLSEITARCDGTYIRLRVHLPVQDVTIETSLPDDQVVVLAKRLIDLLQEQNDRLRHQLAEWVNAG